MATKLILTHEVSGLGEPGDVIEVKHGYARNYLLPRGLATAWTKGAERQIEQIREARRKREIATVEEARAARDSLQAKPVVVKIGRASCRERVWVAESGVGVSTRPCGVSRRSVWS